MRSTPVRIQYDTDTHTVYIACQGTAKLCDSVVVSLNPHVTVDYDKDGDVYGIEIKGL